MLDILLDLVSVLLLTLVTLDLPSVYFKCSHWNFFGK